MRRPLLALLTLAALLCAAAPLRLSAQIRVPRPRVPNPLDRARAAVTPARTPTFDETVIEITDRRLTSFIRGLRAEQDQRPALEAAYKRNADERAAAEVAQRRAGDRISSAQSCFTNSREYRRIFGDTASQRRTKARIDAARERNDEATASRLEDSVANAMMMVDPEVAMGLVQAQQRCGMADTTAYAGAMAAAQTRARVLPPRISLGDSLRVIGTGVSGMTADQYAMMRERVLAFLTTDEDALRGSLWAYTSGELTVLRAKRSDLERYQELLVEG
jgi:hypothetical protein